jgi:hypothetical protein
MLHRIENNGGGGSSEHDKESSVSIKFWNILLIAGCTGGFSIKAQLRGISSVSLFFLTASVV